VRGLSVRMGGIDERSAFLLTQQSGHTGQIQRPGAQAHVRVNGEREAHFGRLGSSTVKPASARARARGAVSLVPPSNRIIPYNLAG